MGAFSDILEIISEMVVEATWFPPGSGGASIFFLFGSSCTGFSYLGGLLLRLGAYPGRLFLVRRSVSSSSDWLF